MSDFFRANVGCLLVNGQGQVLALERTPKGSGRWQTVQGGIEIGEAPVDALYRELAEEIGVGRHDVEIIAQLDDWLAYELPPAARSQKTGRGQVQKWFLCRLADDSCIDITTGDMEFGAWRWTSMQELSETTWVVRRPIYERLRRAFRQHLV